ncbi:MAG: thiamine biosynthesis protein [Ilumatobacteraceae bacterium]|nr:thiamine biosynthesis protein [Ilumatobacteraceae bacterium]
MSTLARADFVVLGTGASVVTSEATAFDAAVAAARAQIDDIDRACSRFRPDSDLERVNQAGGRMVRVGQTFIEALTVALDAARVTGGAVDPTVGRALRLLGYDRDFAAVGTGPAVTRFAEVSGWQVVEIDRDLRTVRVPRGVQLDLGATAKALAADRAAHAAALASGCGVLVSLGGDIACAGPTASSGWPVFVAEWHGADLDADGQMILLHDGGLATSSTRVRRWRRGDDDVHHLIDPTTGRSASEHWRTVSVAAASCVEANIATTASIIRGAPAADWLASMGVPARLVRHDGVVVRLGGWPEDSTR